jgi:hypothetical protein
MREWPTPEVCLQGVEALLNQLAAGQSRGSLPEFGASSIIATDRLTFDKLRVRFLIDILMLSLSQLRRVVRLQMKPQIRVNFPISGRAYPTISVRSFLRFREI